VQHIREQFLEYTMECEWIPCGGDDYTLFVDDNVIVGIIGGGDAVFHCLWHLYSRPCSCCYHHRCLWDDGVLLCVDGISGLWC